MAEPKAYIIKLNADDQEAMAQEQAKKIKAAIEHADLRRKRAARPIIGLIPFSFWKPERIA
jgi:hypothetical protein